MDQHGSQEAPITLSSDDEISPSRSNAGEEGKQAVASSSTSRIHSKASSKPIADRVSTSSTLDRFFRNRLDTIGGGTGEPSTDRSRQPLGVKPIRQRIAIGEGRGSAITAASIAADVTNSGSGSSRAAVARASTSTVGSSTVRGIPDPNRIGDTLHLERVGANGIWRAATVGGSAAESGGSSAVQQSGGGRFAVVSSGSGSKRSGDSGSRLSSKRGRTHRGSKEGTKKIAETGKSVDKSDKGFRCQGKVFSLTYPQCEVDRKVFADAFRAKHYPSTMRSAREQHADGNHHIHLCVGYTKVKNVQSETHFDIDIDGKTYHPNIQKTKDVVAWNKYISKDGDYEDDIAGFNVLDYELGKRKNAYHDHKFTLEFLANERTKPVQYLSLIHI